MATVNPDIRKERASATFDAERLTELIYGGEDKVRRRRYLQNVALQDKYLQSFPPWCNRERETNYDVSVKKSVYIHQLMKDLNITDREEQFYFTEAASFHESSALGLSFSMYIPSIMQQGTPEQVEKYAEPARKCQIIGTYAQTEMGHGTFIRGLETTATYDPKTEEFVINSPTVSSMKYWPGSLGKTSNFVVLMAQLYSQGRCYGMHSFVVQTRDLDNHRPLPGITLGDIGNKLGYNGMDNGFLMFDNVRIPREAMLMRYAKIARDGTYTAPSNTKLTYGAMVFIRSMIVGGCGRALAQSCIIATRYSAVRRQTEIKPGGEEPQVIDYQTQQEKLFPMIASAFALIFTGADVARTYIRVSGDIDKGKTDEAQMLHALAAGLKALSADISNEGIDVLRRACGGHGYSHASGIPKIWTDNTPSCTYEGENTVMYLQCGRYLVKGYAMAASGQQLPGFMHYLNDVTQSTSPIDANFDMKHLIQAYEHRAASKNTMGAFRVLPSVTFYVTDGNRGNKYYFGRHETLNDFRLIKLAAMRIQSLTKSGVDVVEARNGTSVHLVRAAMAHCQAYCVKVFHRVINQSGMDANLGKVMTSLCKLFAVNGIVKDMGSFLQDGYVSGRQAEMLTDKVLSLYADIRPNAVALVDAFDYPDGVLHSCIGRYDGNVYEALYEYAKNSPLNKKDVLDSYYTTLRPLMKGESNIPARL